MSTISALMPLMRVQRVCLAVKSFGSTKSCNGWAIGATSYCPKYLPPPYLACIERHLPCPRRTTAAPLSERISLFFLLSFKHFIDASQYSIRTFLKMSLAGMSDVGDRTNGWMPGGLVYRVRCLTKLDKPSELFRLEKL